MAGLAVVWRWWQRVCDRYSLCSLLAASCTFTVTGTVLIRDLRWYTSRQHGQLSYLSGPIAVVPYSVVIFALRWALRMSLSVGSTTASVVHTIVHDERQTVAQPWAAATSFVVCV